MSEEQKMISIRTKADLARRFRTALASQGTTAQKELGDFILNYVETIEKVSVKKKGK